MVNCFHYILSESIFDISHEANLLSRYVAWQGYEGHIYTILLKGPKHLILISLAIHTI